VQNLEVAQVRCGEAAERLMILSPFLRVTVRV
jgi:hypothetical protein